MITLSDVSLTEKNEYHMLSLEERTISCHSGKQAMSQSSANAATPGGELAGPEETPDVKTQDPGPRQLRCRSKE